jgi:hypothetical protein
LGEWLRGLQKPLTASGLGRSGDVEKIKLSPFGRKVGKSVILCKFIQKMTQFPVNDCFPW